jgi:hypothetical protein
VGDRTTISGHIQEPWYVIGTGGSDDPQLQLLEALNLAVITSLPEVDTDPYLARAMFKFSETAEHSQNTYRGRVIYFGGSYHGLWTEWEEWLEKFECLLRRLHWEHVALVMVTEYMGTHHYFWDASQESQQRLGDTPPQPIDCWVFSGGPRSFWRSLSDGALTPL